MSRFVAVVLGVCITAVAGSAQSAGPAFDAASIRRYAPDGASSGQWVQTAGVFVGTRTVASLIQYAYRTASFLVIGGPDWIRKERFVLSARSEGASNEQMPLMMQTLLEDRFQLRTHIEKREMNGLNLVLARKDGRLGAGLQRVSTCDGDGLPTGDSYPEGATGMRACGVVSLVAAVSSSMLGMPVTDRTGLTGDFRVRLLYSPESIGLGEPVGPNLSTLPSFMTAIEEQLGLKLERAAVTMDVIVVDSVSYPTEN